MPAGPSPPSQSSRVARRQECHWFRLTNCTPHLGHTHMGRYSPPKGSTRADRMLAHGLPDARRKRNSVTRDRQGAGACRPGCATVRIHPMHSGSTFRRTVGVLLWAGLVGSAAGVARAQPADPCAPGAQLTGAAGVQATRDNADDRQALVALYHAAGGPDWLDRTNWLSDQPLGTWFGVEDRGRTRHQSGPVRPGAATTCVARSRRSWGCWRASRTSASPTTP